jgi:hypothetical protein
MFKGITKGLGSFAVIAILVSACGGKPEMADASGTCTDDFRNAHNDMIRDISEKAGNGNGEDAFNTCMEFANSYADSQSCSYYGQTVSIRRLKQTCQTARTAGNMRNGQGNAP